MRNNANDLITNGDWGLTTGEGLEGTSTTFWNDVESDFVPESRQERSQCRRRRILNRYTEPPYAHPLHCCGYSESVDWRLR